MTDETKMGSMQHKQATQTVKKALEEDPTVFQYDELYDEMDERRTRKREEAKGGGDGKKPKYINHLMKTAERRQRENERRIEKQAQTDLEKEGDLYKDKEAFVTEAYKRKIKELKRLEEEEKREDAIDDLAEVTKQKDLSGFYRYLYRQTMSVDDGDGDQKAKEREGVREKDDAKRHAHHHHNQERKEKATAGDNHRYHHRERRRRSRSKERGHSSHHYRRSPKREAVLRGRKNEVMDTHPVLEQGRGKDIDSSASGFGIKLSEHPIWKKRTVGATLEGARARYFQRKQDGFIIAVIVKDK